jgi:NADH-quinone oxidoreductase subunit C
MPDGPGLELIMAELNRAHPGAVVDATYDREQAALVVDPDAILEVLAWLRDTPGQEYTFLSSLHAADYLPAEPRFAVHYELLNRDRYERLRVKALLRDPASTQTNSSRSGNGAGGEGSPMSRNGGSSGRVSEEASVGASNHDLPEIDSCIELFPTADFQEREVYDFFGIVFRGHPDLRRMFMPEDYGGHPQRRDFPIGGEPVIFTRDEVENPGWWQ